MSTELQDDLDLLIQDRVEADPGFEGALRDAEARYAVIDAVLARRTAQGLSQTEVAHRMGTTQSSVSELERCSGDVYLSTLQRYARAVDADLRMVVVLHTDHAVDLVDSSKTGGLDAPIQIGEWKSKRRRRGCDRVHPSFAV